MAKSHRIKSLKITGGFLDGTKINFSNHLNCIIGGRGTGKTTVIEFIRYALNLKDDGRLSPKKWADLEKLIQANLAGGHIGIDLMTKSNVHYSAKRKSGEDKNIIYDENGNPLQIFFG
jgi:predicted ATP-binding protein involved in virulence